MSIPAHELEAAQRAIDLVGVKDITAEEVVKATDSVDEILKNLQAAIANHPAAEATLALGAILYTCALIRTDGDKSRALRLALKAAMSGAEYAAVHYDLEKIVALYREEEKQGDGNTAR